MVIECVFYRLPVVERLKSLQFFVRQGGVYLFGYVHAPQGTYPVNAARPTHLLVVGEFQVRPVFDVFIDVIEIVSRLEFVFKYLTLSVNQR